MLTWRWVLVHLEEMLTALLRAVMIGSIGIGVLFRFVLHQPLSWTEEVILVCMVCMCFLGASVTTKYDEHIFIDFVVTLVPRRFAKIMEIASMEFQAILIDTAQEAQDWYLQFLTSDAGKMLEQLKGYGMAVVEPDVKSFREATTKIWTKPLREKIQNYQV